MSEFRTAARQFVAEHHKKVVLLIEDMQEPLSPIVRAFLGDLLELHNDSLINVIFTISDYSMVSMLKGGKYAHISYCRF